MRGQCGADERPRTGNSREMVAEEDPFVGRHKIAAVVVPFRGGGARIIERKHFRRNKSRI